MDRRQFHKTILAGAVAAAGLTSGAELASAASDPVSVLPHPGDALPLGATTRLGTTRFWHFVERGNEGVNALAFSPDGNTLAALGYQDACISLWEVPSGRMVRKWDADAADRCGELAFSPCGQYLAVGSNDGMRLWNPHTGQLLWRLLEGLDYAYGVAFSPDGRFLAAALPFNGAVNIWDIATRELVARFEADPNPIWPDHTYEKSDRFRSVAFSTDGRLVAAGSEHDFYHDPDKAETKILHQQLLEGHRSLESRGWRDGKIYTIEPRGRVWCWEVATGRRISCSDAYPFPVKMVRFALDGRLVCYGADGAVWLADAHTGQRIADLAPSTGKTYTTAMAFAEDRRHALLSRLDDLALIDVLDGKEICRFPVAPNWSGWRPLAVSPNARWVVADSQGRFDLWDTATGVIISPSARHTTGWVQAVRFTADSRVATATLGEVMLWDATGGLLHQVREKNQLLPSTLALSLDGYWAACVRRIWSPENLERNEVLTWDWQSGEVQSWQERDITALVWSAAGQSILLGTKQGELCVLDLRTGHRQQSWNGIAGHVQDIAQTPDRRLIAALGNGPTIHTGELALGGWQNRLAVPELADKKYNLHSCWGRLAFSPDGNQIALATERGEVCLGPVSGQTLRLVFATPPISEIFASAFALAWLSSGRLLVAVSYYRGTEEEPGPTTIRVFDALTRSEVWAAPPFSRAVNALAFSKDGQVLASGMANGTTLLWKLDASGINQPSV